PLGASREILQVTTVGFMFPVAIAAGAAAAFAVCYESVKEIVTGIAISVALLPPLVTIGIGLGATDWNLMELAIKLFGINLAGIIGVSMIIFALLRFRDHKRALEVDVKKEEKILEMK
ncbi:DUF389 domain-containing protein, partial [Patescibacteria group bacterium]|nr:DUF389 domain-containing protein [Patescibacteria group bacterium]